MKLLEQVLAGNEDDGGTGAALLQGKDERVGPVQP